MAAPQVVLRKLYFFEDHKLELALLDDELSACRFTVVPQLFHSGTIVYNG